MVRRSLPVGDYSINGFERDVMIERKSIPDLLSSLGVDRERFKKELVKTKRYEWKAMVIEGAEKDIIKHHDFSRLHPEAIRQMLVSIEIRYNMHFYYGNNTDDIERWILDRLLKYFSVKRE